MSHKGITCDTIRAAQMAGQWQSDTLVKRVDHPDRAEQKRILSNIASDDRQLSCLARQPYRDERKTCQEGLSLPVISQKERDHAIPMD